MALKKYRRRIGFSIAYDDYERLQKAADLFAEGNVCRLLRILVRNGLTRLEAKSSKGRYNETTTGTPLLL